VGLRVCPKGLFLLLLSLAGCLPGRALSPFDSSQQLDPLILRVENQNLHDATLYLRTQKGREELGSIQSRAIQFFDFGWPAGLPLSIEIELAVGERFRPPPYPYGGVGQLRLTITTELRRSFFSQ